MQPALQCADASQARAAAVFALRAVHHEHAERRRLLQPASKANSDAKTASSQLQQLHRRVTDLLPAKLQSKVKPGSAAAVRLELACLGKHSADELKRLLEASLKECTWSVTPALDGAIAMEAALSMWHTFFCWCVTCLPWPSFAIIGAIQ